MKIESAVPKETANKIVKYLKVRGKMSARDICDDLSVDFDDLAWVWAEGRIAAAMPPIGASFPWFQRKERTNE